MYEFYLTCPRGLEDVLQKEAHSYLKQSTTIDHGGVYFKGTLEDMYRVNYKTRVGMNLHMKLFDGYISNYNDIYKTIYRFGWDELIEANNTFAIRTKINSTIIQKQNFCTMRIKDGIVDKIRKKTNNRPSIDKRNPDFYIFVYIKNKKMKVFLNSSGWPLFMRGYRTKIHKAALNESLASGILMLTDWNKQDPLYDPMCGSGTFLIEGAMLAFNIPPRILREYYAFKKWKDFDQVLWNKVIKEENDKIKYSDVKLYGSDFLSNNIKIANDSINKLKLDQYIDFKISDFKKIVPSENKGIMVTNPPYGYRIGDTEKLQILYKNLGDHLKTNFQGFSGYIFTGNLELLKHVGLRTKKKIILKNGMIDSRLAYYPLKSGKF